MEPAQLIRLALTASIPLLVFALGLRATFAETTTLFRELLRPPNRLLRALVAIYVIVPIATVALAILGDLSRPVKVALLAMAVAPIPPILPGKQLKFGGEKTYVFGLLVAVSLVAIVLGAARRRPAGARLRSRVALFPGRGGAAHRHDDPGTARRRAHVAPCRAAARAGRGAVGVAHRERAARRRTGTGADQGLADGRRAGRRRVRARDCDPGRRRDRGRRRIGRSGSGRARDARACLGDASPRHCRRGRQPEHSRRAARARGDHSAPHGWGVRLVATLLFPK